MNKKIQIHLRVRYLYCAVLVCTVHLNNNLGFLTVFTSLFSI